MGIKALFVGINEYGDAPLNGCVNDAMEMKRLLFESYGGKEASVKVVLDAEATTDRIVTELGWLAEGAADDVRLFHFSGHGTQRADDNADEKDGRDECLVPFDHGVKGMLRDDTLRQLYARFDKRSHVLLVMDCCHSGTIQRDPAAQRTFRFLRPPRDERKRMREAEAKVRTARDAHVAALVEDEVKRLSARGVVPEDVQASIQDLVKKAITKYERKHYGLDTVSGNIVLISGCRSDQTSADAEFGPKFHGALTYYLLEVLREGKGMTYGQLIEELGDRLDDNDFTQTPQLECSKGNRACRFLNVAVGA